MWWWLFRYVLLGPWLRIIGRARIMNKKRIPHTGPVVLVSNHLTFLDSLYLPLMAGRRVTFVTKREYFEGKGPAGAITRWFLTVLGQVPIDPADGRSARAALDTVVRLLDEGHAVGIYPEGTRSRDGRLHKGRTGAARIVLAAKAPVVPVGIIGTPSVNPPGKWLPRFGKVRLIVGEPMDFSSYPETHDARTLRGVTDEVMEAIKAVSGQEYVDEYSPAKS